MSPSIAPSGQTRGVNLTLLYLDGCPHWEQTAANLKTALREVGNSDQPVTLRGVESAEEAGRLAFHGSPTVLIDDIDPFARPDTPVALRCRLYRTGTGLTGAPSVTQLVEALRRSSIARSASA